MVRIEKLTSLWATRARNNTQTVPKPQADFINSLSDYAVYFCFMLCTYGLINNNAFAQETPPTTFAQSDLKNFRADRLRLSSDMRSNLGVFAGDLGYPGEWSSGLWFHYLNSALTVEENGSARGQLLRDQLGVSIAASWSPIYRLRVATRVTGVVLQTRSNFLSEAPFSLSPLETSGLADAVLGVRYQLNNSPQSKVAVGVEASFPTAQPTDAYLGENGFSIRPEILVDVPLLQRLKLQFNASLLFRETQNLSAFGLQVGDELSVAAAARYMLRNDPKRPLEILAAIDTFRALSSADGSEGKFGAELRGGARLGFSETLAFTGGIATALYRGYAVPLIRVFAGINFNITKPPPKEILEQFALKGDEKLCLFPRKPNCFENTLQCRDDGPPFCFESEDDDELRFAPIGPNEGLVREQSPQATRQPTRPKEWWDAIDPIEVCPSIDIAFDVGANLKPDSFRLLDAFVATLRQKKYDGLINIKGFEDRLPTDSQDEMRNKTKTARERAKVVRNYLLYRGLQTRQLKSREYELIAIDSIRDMAKTRKVELRVNCPLKPAFK